MHFIVLKPYVIQMKSVHGAIVIIGRSRNGAPSGASCCINEPVLIAKGLRRCTTSCSLRSVLPRPRTWLATLSPSKSESGCEY